MEFENLDFERLPIKKSEKDVRCFNCGAMGKQYTLFISGTTTYSTFICLECKTSYDTKNVLLNNSQN